MWFRPLLLLLPTVVWAINYKCQNDQVLVVQSFGNDTIRMHCQKLDLCGYQQLRCDYDEHQPQCGGMMNFVSHVHQATPTTPVEHTCCQLFNPRPPHMVTTHAGNDCFIYELPDGSHVAKPKEEEPTSDTPLTVLKSAAEIPEHIDGITGYRLRLFHLKNKSPPTLLVKGIERRLDGYRVTICRPRCTSITAAGQERSAGASGAGDDGTEWKVISWSSWTSTSWTTWANSVGAEGNRVRSREGEINHESASPLPTTGSNNINIDVDANGNNNNAWSEGKGGFDRPTVNGEHPGHINITIHTAGQGNGAVGGVPNISANAHAENHIHNHGAGENDGDRNGKPGKGRGIGNSKEEDAEKGKGDKGSRPETDIGKEEGSVHSERPRKISKRPDSEEDGGRGKKRGGSDNGEEIDNLLGGSGKGKGIPGKAKGDGGDNADGNRTGNGKNGAGDDGLHGSDSSDGTGAGGMEMKGGKEGGKDKNKGKKTEGGNSGSSGPNGAGGDDKDLLNGKGLNEGKEGESGDGDGKKNGWKGFGGPSGAVGNGGDNEKNGDNDHNTEKEGQGKKIKSGNGGDKNGGEIEDKGGAVEAGKNKGKDGDKPKGGSDGNKGKGGDGLHGSTGPDGVDAGQEKVGGNGGKSGEQEPGTNTGDRSGDKMKGAGTGIGPSELHASKGPAGVDASKNEGVDLPTEGEGEPGWTETSEAEATFNPDGNSGDPKEQARQGNSDGNGSGKVGAGGKTEEEAAKERKENGDDDNKVDGGAGNGNGDGTDGSKSGAGGAGSASIRSPDNRVLAENAAQSPDGAASDGQQQPAQPASGEAGNDSGEAGGNIGGGASGEAGAGGNSGGAVGGNSGGAAGGNSAGAVGGNSGGAAGGQTSNGASEPALRASATGDGTQAGGSSQASPVASQSAASQPATSQSAASQPAADTPSAASMLDAMKNMNCFAADALVTTVTGTKRMDEIQVGDFVLVPSANSVLKYERVEMFYHREEETRAQFVVIFTELGKRMALTPLHLLPFGQCEDVMRFKNSSEGITDFLGASRYAYNAKIGDCVLSMDFTGELIADRITKIGRQFSSGIYSPMTVEGSLLVNGILASCFSQLESHNVHKTVFDFLMYFRNWFGYADHVHYDLQGIPSLITYVHELSHYLLPFAKY